jgi:hypothetical protein
MKIPMTPSGIEPAAQFPIQLRYPVATPFYVQTLMLNNLCHLIQTLCTLLCRPVDVCLYLKSG